MVEPRIELLEEKKLVGYSLKMSLIENKTGQLWGRFGPRIKEITNRVSNDKISMQLYDTNYFESYKPAFEFVKWATVEVSTFSNIPEGLETFILKKGLYAVFEHKGSGADSSIFEYIFTKWIPNSAYLLDERPHFELLGDKYKNNDPDSEEEIWIPIKEK